MDPRRSPLLIHLEPHTVDGRLLLLTSFHQVTLARFKEQPRWVSSPRLNAGHSPYHRSPSHSRVQPRPRLHPARRTWNLNPMLCDCVHTRKATFAQCLRGHSQQTPRQSCPRPTPSNSKGRKIYTSFTASHRADLSVLDVQPKSVSSPSPESKPAPTPPPARPCNPHSQSATTPRAQNVSTTTTSLPLCSPPCGKVNGGHETARSTTASGEGLVERNSLSAY